MISNDYKVFAQKLLAKTEEGKILWKDTFDNDLFFATLEDKYTCQISKGLRGRIALAVQDESEAQLFSLAADYPNQETTPPNDEIYDILESLYDRARRIALHIDEKVAEATNLLDHL